MLDALAPNGIYMVTGIPGEQRSIQIPGAQLMRELVLDNQVMVGSVNAARGHYQMAVEDLFQARQRLGDRVAGLITHHLPYTDFAQAFDRPPEDEIKAVLEWHTLG